MIRGRRSRLLTLVFSAGLALTSGTASADLPIDPAHQLDGTPVPPAVQNVADQLKVINDRLIANGRIVPLPPSAWDFQRWANNCNDDDIGPASKCANIVREIVNEMKNDQTFTTPPNVNVVWLEYDLWPFNHSVIGFTTDDGSLIGIIDPWRQNFTGVYDAGWKPSNPGIVTWDTYKKLAPANTQVVD